MRIFATSDLHGHLDEFKRAVEATPCDLVVVAGDLVDMLTLKSVAAYHIWNRFCRFCVQHPQREFLFVPGNHEDILPLRDFFQRHNLNRVKRMIEGMLPHLMRCPDNLRIVDHETVTIDGVRFHCAKKYEGELDDGSVDVRVYHYNPFSATDCAPNPMLKPAGTKLVLFGHHHPHHGHSQVIGGALSANVSSDIKHGAPYSFCLFDLTNDGAVEVSR